MRRVAALTMMLTALTACGGGPEPDVTDSQTTGTNPSASADPTQAPSSGSIVKSGFGVQEGYAWVTALVKSDSDKIGQTVTVSFSLKDAAGTILVTEEQIEGFTRPRDEIVVGTQVELPAGAKPASLEASLLIEDESTFGGEEPSPAIGVGPVKVSKGQYGEGVATFELTNPTAAIVKDLRLGVICSDASGKVVGGTSEFPDLIPASGKIRVDASLTTTGIPAGCDVRVGFL